MPSVPPMSRARWLALLVLAAALVRLLILIFLPRVVHGDEAAYLLIGRSIWQGEGTPHTHPPLLPLLAGAVWRLTGDPELGTGLWFVVFGALTVVPLYRLAEALASRRTALLAAGLYAAYPALTTAIPYWSSMSEPPFIFFVYSGVACAYLGSRRERPGLLAWAGACFGLAYLTRPEGGLWLLTSALAFVASRWLLRQPVARATTRAWAGLAAGFFVVALPYLVVLRLDTGRWAASGKVAIAYEVGEAVLREDPQMFDRITNSLDEKGKTQWLSEKRFERSLPQRILHQPGEVAARVGRNLVRLAERIARQSVFPVTLAALVLVAWTLRPRTRERLAGDVWILAAALPVSAFLLFHIEQRYVCPAFPALLVWVAAGFDELARRWLNPPRSALRTAATTAVALVVAGSVLYGHWSIYQEKKSGVWPSRREAGLWIRDHTPADARLLSFDDGFCVYADRPCIPSPRALYPQWIRFAQERRASYLVVEEDEVRNFRPFLAFLLNGDPPPELEAVYRTAGPVNRVVVFRLVSPPELSFVAP